MDKKTDFKLKRMKIIDSYPLCPVCSKHIKEYTIRFHNEKHKKYTLEEREKELPFDYIFNYKEWWYNKCFKEYEEEQKMKSLWSNIK
jgi:hypothetical protein